MRAHKIVMEAMQRLRMKYFKEWMDENKKDAYQAVADEMDTVTYKPTRAGHDLVILIHLYMSR